MNASLNVQTIQFADAKPHPRNPRIHPVKGSPEWETLCASLRKSYFDPLVINSRNMTMVSGHLRLKILADLGYASASMVVVDMDEDEHLARMIAANAPTGHTDVEKVKDIFSDLSSAGMDLSLTNLTRDSIRDLMGDAAMMDGESEEEPQPPKLKECPACGFKFQ